MNDIIRIYKDAFAEEPWDEYMKCRVCGINYGRDEVREGSVFDRRGVEWEYKEPKVSPICESCGKPKESRACKECGTELSARITKIIGGSYALTSEDFVPYWSSDEIREDLEFALSQKNPIVLVAEDSDGLVGFIWGYRIPREKFPFLQNVLGINMNNTLYMDEIAVDPTRRRMGIGTKLGQAFLDAAWDKRCSGVLLRTDQRNTASMALFRKLGFRGLTEYGVYDPEYPDRVYLRWKKVTYFSRGLGDSEE